jgi:hypothetical protein
LPQIGSDDGRAAFSRVLVSLYKGVLYRDNSEKLWNDLLGNQARAADHFSIIGLQLIVDEKEGFAYLRYPHPGDVPNSPDDETPKLVARRSLTFQVSLLLALLRKRLAEFDASGEGTRLVMTLDEIVATVDIFMPEGGNEARVTDKIEANINKIKDMGFIRSLKNRPHEYEVLGIIKAFVDAEWEAEFERRLADYKNHIRSGAAGREKEE